MRGDRREPVRWEFVLSHWSDQRHHVLRGRFYLKSLKVQAAQQQRRRKKGRLKPKNQFVSEKIHFIKTEMLYLSGAIRKQNPAAGCLQLKLNMIIQNWAIQTIYTSTVIDFFISFILFNYPFNISGCIILSHYAANQWAGLLHGNIWFAKLLLYQYEILWLISQVFNSLDL